MCTIIYYCCRYGLIESWLLGRKQIVGGGARGFGETTEKAVGLLQSGGGDGGVDGGKMVICFGGRVSRVHRVGEGSSRGHL